MSPAIARKAFELLSNDQLIKAQGGGAAKMDTS